MTGTSYRALFDLSGRTALVTGGAGRLGRAFCEAYAEFGANIAVVDIDEDGATATANDLRERFGVEAASLVCDVSDEKQVRAMADEAVRTLGHIDILHNNAANQSAGLKAQFARFEDYDVEDWNRVMAVDVRGMFLVAQAVGAGMASAGRGGSIIQTSSIYGALGPDNRIYEGLEIGGAKVCNPAVYSTGKSAILGLTRWLATYWAGNGIRVNALVAGGVEGGQPEAFRMRYAGRVPLARMARRHEIAAAAVFLASDAASYVTGQCLFVDGGLSAW